MSCQKLMAQYDLVATMVDKGMDSVWAYPAYFSEFPQASLAQKIPNISTAEKQWDLVRKEHNLTAEATALLHLSDAYIAFGKDKEAYERLNQLIQIKEYLFTEEAISHLYYNMAVLLAHNKQYALAMDAFYNAKNMVPDFNLKRKRRKYKPVDAVLHFAISTDLQGNSDEEWQKSADGLDERFLQLDTARFQSGTILEDSEPIVLDSVLYAFDDHKKANSYAVLLHVKQPIPGKKKLFTHFSDVGHTFITLIKYNQDGSCLSKTFGLYPEIGFLFSATPLFPKTEPLYKNDATHSWDELLGKFVSGEQFNRILEYIDQTGNIPYHLNSNNCSDFALMIATIAGIEISDTKAAWPLGYGNNPASTGQSILAANYKNYETNSREGILAVTNHLFLKIK